MSHLNRQVYHTALAVVFWCAVAAPANAGPSTVEISRQDCQRLTVHVPDPGTAYQPGVDVHGRAVASAELGGTPSIALPETFVIDIEIDLQDRFSIPKNADFFDADAKIGVVEVAPDGAARFNGQPLEDQAQVDLARRCQKVLQGRSQASRP